MSLTDETITSKNQLEAAAQKEVLTITQELEAARQDLDLANLELDDYRKRLLSQGDTIKEIEVSFEFRLSSIKQSQSLEINFYFGLVL